MRISAIAAIGLDRAIGKDGDLVWRNKRDFEHFINTTNGHVVVMGMGVFKELKEKPLPNRINILVTRKTDYKKDGIIVCHSIEEAIETAKKLEKNNEIFIIGGGQIYQQALPVTERLYLTIINREFPGADTFFPDYSEFTKVINQQEITDEDPGFKFITLERQ